MKLRNTSTSIGKETVMSPKMRLNKFYGSQGYDAKSSWALQRIIPSASTGILVGETGVFKTFVVIAMACSIATGTSFGEELTDKGFCVLISGEGSSNVARRVRAWEETNNTVVDKGLLRIDQAMNPLESEEYHALLEVIETHKSETNQKPSLIIFDTLSQCSAGIDENSATAMSEFLNACNALASETGASVLLIHHNNRSGVYRGSGTLECNVDYMLTLNKSKEDMKTNMGIRKMKDGETSLVYQIEMHKLDLGLSDQFGEAMSSLSVKSLEKVTKPSRAPLKGKTVDQDTVIILKIISDLTSTTEEKVCYKKARQAFVSELLKSHINEGTAGNRFSKAFKLACGNGQLSKLGDKIVLSNEKQVSSPQLSFPF